MGFQVSNLTSRTFVLKAVEFMFVFIVFLLFRCGEGGDMHHWGQGTAVTMTERAENDLVMGTATSSVFLFIVMVIMLASLMGDKPAFTVSEQR